VRLVAWVVLDMARISWLERVAIEVEGMVVEAYGDRLVVLHKAARLRTGMGCDIEEEGAVLDCSNFHWWCTGSYNLKV